MKGKNVLDPDKNEEMLGAIQHVAAKIILSQIEAEVKEERTKRSIKKDKCVKNFVKRATKTMSTVDIIGAETIKKEQNEVLKNLDGGDCNGDQEKGEEKEIKNDKGRQGNDKSSGVTDNGLGNDSADEIAVDDIDDRSHGDGTLGPSYGTNSEQKSPLKGTRETKNEINRDLKEPTDLQDGTNKHEVDIHNVQTRGPISAKHKKFRTSPLGGCRHITVLSLSFY